MSPPLPEWPEERALTTSQCQMAKTMALLLWFALIVIGDSSYAELDVSSMVKAYSRHKQFFVT